MRFVRVQCQACFRNPFANRFEGLGCFFGSAAENDKVIRITPRLEARSSHLCPTFALSKPLDDYSPAAGVSPGGYLGKNPTYSPRFGKRL